MAKQKMSSTEDGKRVDQAFSALEAELEKVTKAPPDRVALKASVARLREAVGKV